VFELAGPEVVIGRQPGVEARLAGTNVSRRHARVVRDGAGFFLEDLGSSNGTFLNGRRLEKRMALRPRDEIRIGSWLLRFELPDPDATLTIRARTKANTSNADLYRENPAQKLQSILQLSAALSRSLDANQLFPELLGHLFAFFPQAERGLVIMVECGQPVIRAHRHRAGQESNPSFSHSIVEKVLEEKTGVVAEDVRQDERFAMAQSLGALGVSSLMCVPLQNKAGRAFGVLQLERLASDGGFTHEDLNFLTTIGLHASVVLENAQLHQEQIVRQRLERELALAREIQISYLPVRVPQVPGGAFELHGELFPAQEIAGDFYDYFQVGPDRLALAVGDVTGKGMPAALFMSLVQAHLRGAALPGKTAGEIARSLNNTLAAENAKCFFATLAFCLYHPATGAFEAVWCGHPPGLLRRAGGRVETLAAPIAPLLGFEARPAAFPSAQFQLDPGDLLALYTDGITEAPSPQGTMFGEARLRECLHCEGAADRLPDLAEQIRKSVAAFSAAEPQEDDITLALLRRK